MPRELVSKVLDLVPILLKVSVRISDILAVQGRQTRFCVLEFTGLSHDG